MTILDTSPSSALRARISSAVVEPGDPDWAAATEAFNLAFVQKPALVAIPADESDVIEIVNFARERGMQVAPQRTGHNAEPLGAMEDVILVRTDRLRGVEIDAARRIARVRAGAKWRDVLPLASEFGLAALHGSTGDVSVAGYSLGGGVGWYARKHGLSANSVVAIELVTPDGRFRRVDADNDPDLFWGLRGGGGNFGIVTALEIRLYPIASVYAGMMFFAFERAHEVLHAWRGWTTTAPEDVTSVGRLLQFPPIPDLPPEFSGRRFVAVDAVVIGDQARGEQLLAPLRALGPEIDTFALVPPADIGELHMDPPSPRALRGGRPDARRPRCRGDRPVPRGRRTGLGLGAAGRRDPPRRWGVASPRAASRRARHVRRVVPHARRGHGPRRGERAHQSRAPAAHGRRVRAV
jgi:hypothetical protein